MHSCRSTMQGRASECCLSAGPAVCRSTRRPNCHTAAFTLPGCPCLDSRKGNSVGEPKLGSTVPPPTIPFSLQGPDVLAVMQEVRGCMFFPVCALAPDSGGALCRRRRSPRRCRSRADRESGRERPHFCCPRVRPRGGPDGGRSRPTCMSRSSGETALCRRYRRVRRPSQVRCARRSLQPTERLTGFAGNPRSYR